MSVSKILTKLRRGRILSVQSLEDGLAEIAEGVTLDSSPLIGKQVESLGLTPLSRLVLRLLTTIGPEKLAENEYLSREIGTNLTQEGLMLAAYFMKLFRQVGFSV